MNRKTEGFSRRDLLNLGARLGIGAAGWAALSDLRLIQSASAQGGGGPSDYKALVCVFLSGGNDSMNLVVPRSNAEYQTYLASRGNLAIAQNALLPITPITSDGAQYGLHPSTPELQSLFAAGKLAILANVGSLVAPITVQQYHQGGQLVPPQLFSHADQQFQWQTSTANTLLNVGWAGRVADAVANLNGGSPLATNITLSGSNTLQIGHDSLPYTLGVNGVIELSGLYGSWNQRRRQAFDALLNGPHTHLMEGQYAGMQTQAMQIHDLIKAALDAAPALNTTFPTSWLGRQLKMVARMISIRQSLGLARQIYFVSTGGFDTHDHQTDNQPGLFADMSTCFSAFQAAMDEILASNQVTLFTGSDFGRTLSSNGDGSDHGWGGHQLILGGAVNGRDIYGAMPNLTIDGPDDTGHGRILPTTSVDQYSGTLAKWFGVSVGDLATIFPNLGNFGVQDMGFLT